MTPTVSATLAKPAAPKPCVIANWKMQGSRRVCIQLVFQLARSSRIYAAAFETELDVVLCPPFVYLSEVAELLKANNASTRFKLGAQNIYYESKGAFTGEISPEMLVDIGCRYVIVGHSERRQLFLEDDARIARKFKAAYDAGLIPILCVGETQAERAAGKTFEVVSQQLEAVLEQVSVQMLAQSVIAYEPIWAIGTGLTATPEQAEAVHHLIRQWIARQDPQAADVARIIYGGSVKAENAKGLLSMLNINGALVGAASLNAEEFLSICRCIID